MFHFTRKPVTKPIHLNDEAITSQPTTVPTSTMASAGNKSVISDDMQELNQGPEDISKTIQGHKANLSNPSTA